MHERLVVAISGRKMIEEELLVSEHCEGAAKKRGRRGQLDVELEMVGRTSRRTFSLLLLLLSLGKRRSILVVSFRYRHGSCLTKGSDKVSPREPRSAGLGRERKGRRGERTDISLVVALLDILRSCCCCTDGWRVFSLSF